MIGPTRLGRSLALASLVDEHARKHSKGLPGYNRTRGLRADNSLERREMREIVEGLEKRFRAGCNR